MKKAPAITLVVVFVLAIVAVIVLTRVVADTAQHHSAAAMTHTLPTSGRPEFGTGQPDVGLKHTPTTAPPSLPRGRAQPVRTTDAATQGAPPHRPRRHRRRLG